jgi:hypothetical protein
MANLSISADRNNITVNPDQYWQTFTANGNTVSPGDSVTYPTSVEFTGTYYYGTPAVPASVMSFASGTGNTAEYWIAIIRYTGNDDQSCTVTGTILYGNPQIPIDSQTLALALFAASEAPPVTVMPAGTQQVFSAGGLSGQFDVTA